MMKKLFGLALLLITGTISAQTVKNQSVNLNLLGFEYKHEIPINKASTLIFHGGLVGSLGYSSTSFSLNESLVFEDDNWFSALSGKIGTDFRYYYNLSKRQRKGKNTRKNSANFLAVDLQYITPSFFEHNMKHKNTFALSPYWGLRRVYRNNWLIEFQAGLIFGKVGSEFAGGGKLDFIVGYSF